MTLSASALILNATILGMEGAITNPFALTDMMSELFHDFVSMLASNVYFIFILGMLYVIPSLSMEWGSTKQFGALIITMAAVCEFFCRLAIFPLTGYFKINIYKFMNVCLLPATSGLVSIYFSTKTALMVHGLFHGMFALFFIPLMTLLVKVYNY